MNDNIIERKITPAVLNNIAFKEVIEGYIKNPETLEDIDLFSKGFQKIKEIESKNDIKIIEPIFAYLKESYEPIKTYKLFKNSPFKALDDPNTMLLRNGLITIGAKANTGKTSLATHLAIEIMKTNKSTCFIFFSLDDSRGLGIKRMLSQITKKSYMRTCKESEETTEIQSLINELTHDVFILDDGNSLESIQPSIEVIKQRGAYENVIVCIDYLQLLASEKPLYSSDKRNFLNESLKKIKQIQKDTNSFFMILSQLKRDGNGTDFEYRETSEIENVSDICIDLKYSDDSDNDKSTPERLIRISKNKIGVKGQSYTTSINEYFLFSELKPKTNFTGNQSMKKQNINDDDKWAKAREKTALKKS